MCYALTMAKRLKGMGSAKYQRDGDPRTSGPGFGLTTHDDVLTEPLKWRKPARVFVNSMSDLFHDAVPDEFIAKVWAVMAATPQHTYQILTKRHGRMRSLLRDECRCGNGHVPGIHFCSRMNDVARWIDGVDSHAVYFDTPWPLPQVWLGVSVEDQKRAELRIPALPATPAAVRFVSAEPLLGPVDLSVVYARNGTLPIAPLDVAYDQDTGAVGRGIDWLIVGGESGPGARSCDPAWIRSLVGQCQAAGVPVFVKQLGSVWARQNSAGSSKGDNPDEWPADLRIREFPIGGRAVLS